MDTAATTPTAVIDYSQLEIHYDKRSDIFSFRAREATKWVADDVEGEFFVLRDVETGAPVGFLVEDFEHVFLKRHPEIEHAWKEARAPWRRWSEPIHQGLKALLAGFFVQHTSPQLRLGLQNG